LEGGIIMPISKDDTFLLWSFAYMSPPEVDKPHKRMTTRGRTWQEAWTYIQTIKQSFLEPEKVGVAGAILLTDKEAYCKSHPHDWLHDAPLWLKQQEGATELIW
jgi:hypothetical protein